VDSNGNFIFSGQPVNEKKLLDVSNVVVYPNSTIMATKPDGSYDTFTSGPNQIDTYDQLTSLIASNEYAGYRRALKTDSENYINSAETYDPNENDGIDWWKGLSYEMVVHQVAVAPFGDFGSVYGFSTFLPQSVSCGSTGVSFAMLLDTFTGLPKPTFSSMEFSSINKFQEFHAPQNADGQKAVSDHVYQVNGLSAATIFVMTGTNAQKRGQFETVNSDGTVTVIKLPEKQMPHGGINSWREVLDFSAIGAE
jgi:Tfp pilus tip-associated adhesin PilY1